MAISIPAAAIPLNPTANPISFGYERRWVELLSASIKSIVRKGRVLTDRPNPPCSIGVYANSGNTT